MGSIPVLISTDLVPAAGTPVGGTGIQLGLNRGAPSSTSDGFGQMFAEQIAVVVMTDAAVALGTVPQAPSGPSVSSMPAVPSVPGLPTVTSSRKGTAFSLESLTLPQLLDVNSVSVLDGPTTPASSLGALTEEAPSPVPATGPGLVERPLPPAPSTDYGLMSTGVGASTRADATVKPRSPTLIDAVSLGLASIAPSSGDDVPLVIQPTLPTPLATIEQMPRNGRPIEAQPDQASYFVVLPPSPLAQTQARLVQTLSSPSDEPVLQPVPRAGSFAESTKGSPALPAPAAFVAPIDVGSATWQEPPTTSGVVIAPPVTRRTHLSSLTTTVAEVVAGEDVSGEWSAEATPLMRSSDRGISRLVMPMKSVPDVEKTPVLSAEMSRPPGMLSLSLGVPASPDKHALSHMAAIRADEDATADSTATPADQPTVSAAATSLTERPDGDSLVMAPSLAPPPETSVVDENAVTAVMIPPAGPLGSQIRTPEPPTVSERARLQDPLRGIDAANQSASTASTSAGTSSTPPSTAIPFALPTVTGGATAAILPNPLERNIARQLTQQLSAPLGSLAGTGAQRKAAVDKSLIIRLTPPELGTVRIEISQRNGDLTIRMHAEDPAVRQAIERMLPSLRTDLRQADSPLLHITVASSGSEERGSGERNSGDRNSGERGGADDRNAWQGQQQRQDRAPDGDRQPSHRDGERPVFSLSGMPSPEPIVVASRGRSLGGRSSTTGVDALA